uniref:Centrosomal protein of 164 kDa n=1 Tax=Sphenodon punctatus TaxID=8508 RepID=A0A8D0L4D2_SPHPU
MERMREEHRKALAKTQDQYEEEERNRRAELLEKLKGDLERLRRLHESELKALQQELDGQLGDQRRRHQEKERKLQDLEMELELRGKEAQARSIQLNAQEEAIRKKRQQLLDEEKQFELERNEAAVASRLRQEEVRKEQADLTESIRELRRTLGALQDQKAELESQVELLQSHGQRLQKRVSELESAIKSKREVLKELVEKESDGSPGREAELQVEDLRETLRACSPRETVCLTARSNEDGDLRLDGSVSERHLPPHTSVRCSGTSDSVTNSVRHYISAEGFSIKNAKEFLLRQTRSMQKRQSALKAAKQQWRHDMQESQEAVRDPDSSQILEDVRRNLEEEAKQLEEMKLAMRKSQVLLKKKEEKLSQLESSLLEELSDEDTLKGAACKKVVTFDLSDSEDTSSLVSTDVPQPKLDFKLNPPFPHLDKIQHLTDSLQRITSDLNGVLGILGSLSSQQPPPFTSTPVPVLPREGLPLSAYSSLARAQAAGPFVPPAGAPLVNQWAWSTSASPDPAALASQSVDNMLMEKWCKYFPGGVPLLCGTPAPLDSKLGYVPAGEQISLFQRSQLRGPEPGRMSVQGMIEANKKWLENFRRDSKSPLFPGAPAPSTSSSGLVQLALDENNQIKVYHY